MPESVWPAAPRPFPDEAFGGWFGRVAGRYGITVDELAAAAGIRLDLNPEGSGWIAARAPAGRWMRQLAALCRLAPQEVEGLRKPVRFGIGGLAYCYQCLVLNPRDVFSPYWREIWIGASSLACPEHKHGVGYLSPKDMQERRNLPRLMRMLERRWQRIEFERRRRR